MERTRAVHCLACRSVQKVTVDFDKKEEEEAAGSWTSANKIFDEKIKDDLCLECKKPRSGAGTRLGLAFS